MANTHPWPPRTKVPFGVMRRANDVIAAALVVVDDFVEANEAHLPTCNTKYLNGSPCSCGLPELVAALNAYDEEKMRQNRRDAKTAPKAATMSSATHVKRDRTP